MATQYFAFKNHMKDRLGARVHKFFVDYAKTQSQGQGVLGIHCKPLWDMTNKQFEELFGVKIQEEVLGADNKRTEHSDESQS